MSEQFKPSVSPVSPQSEPDVVALIKKIQDHLVVLERKIDSLINKPQERPFREKHFSKPFRSFGHSPRHGKEEREHHSREGGFPQGHQFKKNQSSENQGFGQKKKPFYLNRKTGGRQSNKGYR